MWDVAPLAPIIFLVMSNVPSHLLRVHPMFIYLTGIFKPSHFSAGGINILLRSKFPLSCALANVQRLIVNGINMLIVVVHCWMNMHYMCKVNPDLHSMC